MFESACGQEPRQARVGLERWLGPVGEAPSTIVAVPGELRPGRNLRPCLALPRAFPGANNKIRGGWDGTILRTTRAVVNNAHTPPLARRSARRWRTFWPSIERLARA